MTVAIRPEAIRLGTGDAPPEPATSCAAPLVESAFLGNIVDHQIDVGGMLVRVQGDRQQSLRARRRGRAHDSRRRVRRHAQRRRVKTVSRSRTDHEAQKSAFHHVGRAQQARARLPRASDDPHAQPRPAGGRGVRFTDAYCNSPICVPSRASFQTGRYVHDIRFWDNAIAYDGSVPSWAHRLKAAGHRVDSIGKLHFRSAEDDNGFTKEHMPLHVVEGIGDPIGMLRDPPPPRKAALKLAADAGCGDSTYQGYDDRITEAAEGWLRERAATQGQQALGAVRLAGLPALPADRAARMVQPLSRGQGAVAGHLRRGRAADASLRRRPCAPARSTTRASTIRAKVRKAIAAYFGLVSFVDHNVGRLVKALEDNGLSGDTRVIYTSDHGDNLGTRGLWGKSNMYEESAGVPMIMAGPGGAAGRRLPRAGLARRLLPDHRRLRRACARIPTIATCRAPR